MKTLSKKFYFFLLLSVSAAPNEVKMKTFPFNFWTFHIF